VSLPGLSSSSGGVVEAVALSKTTRLLAGSRETTSFSVLVDRVDDPVDSRVSSDSLVGGVNEDDLEILVCRILVDPVRVEDPQVGASSTDPFLGGRSEGSLVLQLVDTLVGRLAVSGTFG